MKIKYTELKHNMEGYAPFVGAVLQAKGDSEKYHTMNIKKLMQEITNNPNNKGVILTGNWSLQPYELIEILKFTGRKNLGVVIYTDFDFNSFKAHIGVACAERVEKKKIKQEDVAENFSYYGLMGAMIMDYYVTDDYYIVADKQVIKIKKASDEDGQEENNSKV